MAVALEKDFRVTLRKGPSTAEMQTDAPPDVCNKSVPQ